MKKDKFSEVRITLLNQKVEIVSRAFDRVRKALVATASFSALDVQDNIEQTATEKEEGI